MLAFAGSAASAATNCQPIQGLEQISWGFPKGPGGVGDGTFLGYSNHDDYFLNYVCHSVFATTGGTAATCITSEQLAGEGAPDNTAPDGWNLYYAGCGVASRGSRGR
jgi:hypothetical protein